MSELEVVLITITGLMGKQLYIVEIVCKRCVSFTITQTEGDENFVALTKKNYRLQIGKDS